MIQTRFIDNNIRISCTKSEVISITQLKRLFRIVYKLIEQHDIAPIIVDLEDGARLSNSAQQIFNRWNRFTKPLTMVIIKF